MNSVMSSRSYGFDCATQEFANKDGKRSDIIVWSDVSARVAVLATELKTPTTALSDPTFRADAVRKAQTVNAPYLALWNMRRAELYRTPPQPRKTLESDDFIATVGEVASLTKVEHWLQSSVKDQLHDIARLLLLAAHDLLNKGSYGGIVIDPVIFVDSLKDPVGRLRASLRNDVNRSRTKDRKLNARLQAWVDQQGLSHFVSDVDDALAGQIAYRLTGQILFYYAFRRQEPTLPEIRVKPGASVTAELRKYWDRVRVFDYEALYQESILEEIGMSTASESIVRHLVQDLAAYNWDEIRLDVLGAIFEQLIPESERILLGQYYTPAQLADVVLSLTLEDNVTSVLDPAVGSGTFLFRAHDRLARKLRLAHKSILDILWGFDISSFPAELAVINLCRQDLSSQANYPRVGVRDFFYLNPGDSIDLPLPKSAAGATGHIATLLPQFDAVVGNPPFVRSQQLDDLDAKYKGHLSTIAAGAGVMRDAKFDAFAYFILHAEKFLKPGGRLGLITSAAWLTTEYGAILQRYLLEKLHIKHLVFSAAEPFFPYQKINTIILVAEKPLNANAVIQPVTFLTFTRSLLELFGSSERANYWIDIDSSLDAMLSSADGVYDHYSIRRIDAANALAELTQAPTKPLNWARPFRTSDIYEEIFK